MLIWRGSVLSLIALVCAGVAASCAQEDYPASLWNAQHAQSRPPAIDAAAPSAPACVQARGNALVQRLEAMTNNAAPVGNVVLVSDLFDRFNSVCGSCHGPAVDPPGNGGFQITTAADFPGKMTATVLGHVTSDVPCPYTPDPTNPQDPMPPCSSPNGMLYSQRAATDPVREFAALVQAWLAAGSPPSFTPPSGDDDAGAGADAGAGSLSLSVSVGTTLTDVGSCIPTPNMVATESARSLALDKMFAGLTAATTGTAAQQIGLPEHLGETDLFTFDSAVLAPYGVVAFAPGYPLWSDNAGKLRFVRVPRGTSIQFNKATQSFTIPPNTRFYKTFMRQIVDTDGSLRYRKMETRLIVSRPDTINADGSATPTALFGTYQWNDDESDAVLVETPLRSGLPFADTVFLYNIDEPLAANVLKGDPAAPEEALLEAQAARHYAIPSSERCVECHMGSMSQSFVLGFMPLQINRRPVGAGGVIQPTGADDINQLQRLIDYGIITGMDSPADVLPLEESQGTRAPRNNYELTAQGYMLGNCAHCHNPRGYPTIQNPVLADVLDFFPTPGPLGGIFQFSLETYSPRISRGLTGSTPIPYITPSLVDLPRYDPISGNQAPDVFIQGTGPEPLGWVIYAPWRSLIYRNVDNAFAYTDDLALYPHMPFNTPGYDPQAKQIMSDWMVSIPAVRKRPDIVEYAYQTNSSVSDNYGSEIVDTTPQPYVEVLPGAPAYDAALAAANARLQILHSGANPGVPIDPSGKVYSRYADQGETADILDPAVVADPICDPVPVGNATLNTYPFAEHPHWVITDLSQPPGPYAPRQTNWPTVLVDQKIPPPSSGCKSPAGAAAAYADQVAAVGLLQSATLDQVRAYVTTPVPFGLWQMGDADCDFSSIPTVQSFTGANRAHWMDYSHSATSGGGAAIQAPSPDAPVYMEPPGAAVFKMICINCHGPNADANGRLAQNLATMTGGLANVANFRDGLFGPIGAPETSSNRHLAFGLADLPGDASAAWTGVTDDDRAARYMPWMALGGTSVEIPLAILQLVAITHVLDQQRALEASALSANMLSEAKALCLSLMGPDTFDAAYSNSIHLNPAAGHGYLDADQTFLNHSLIFANGDAELWLHLCSTANPPPIHIVQLDSQGALQLRVKPVQNTDGVLDIEDQAPGTLISAGDYNVASATSVPPGGPVGDGYGGADPTLDPSNVWPWCVDDTGATSAQTAWLASNAIAICPSDVISYSRACGTLQAPPSGTCFGTADANTWAVRGAVNAGMSVYLYVQSIEDTGPAPDFNQCERLK